MVLGSVVAARVSRDRGGRSSLSFRFLSLPFVTALVSEACLEGCLVNVTKPEKL